MQQLSGVGPGLAARLGRIGIHHPRDLLFHLPYRYQDRTRLSPIGDLQPGREALILGRVDGAEVRYGRRRSLLVRVREQSGALSEQSGALSDQSGALGDQSDALSAPNAPNALSALGTPNTLQLRFFHFSAAQQHAFQPDAWIRCYGEVRSGPGGAEMVHPEYRLYRERPAAVTEAALTPVYPGTEGISPAMMRKLVAQTLAGELKNLQEYLPAEVREGFALMPVNEALELAHRPPPGADTEALVAGIHPAQRRLAVEELLAHHLALSRLRAKHQARNAPPCDAGAGSWEKLKAQLGFSLTAAQQRVIAEVLADLKTPTPAMRLIQGDVGSGKTVVAAAAALCAIDANCQVALMAPTELLSEQHRKTFSNWFAYLDREVEWLTGKMPAAARAQSLARIQAGTAKMVIGTHALFQQHVKFHRLGLMIIDEQHRFGVDQRLALRNKAEAGDGGGPGDPAPHQIIMSATPIPRSLAMIFYADLDVSSIDELPPGRKPVQTVVLPNNRRDEVAARIRGICGNRQQAYWVCSLIEESDKLQAQAATETREALGRLLPELTIELIHGRMKSVDKEAIMWRFHHGEIDLLVATTVIEVGVDVPSASLMIIENAERLGLAQLHQLRGRVGRGTAQATCVLLYQPPLGKSAKARLGTLRDTNDGFVIANKDLEQRGPGELLGTRQTGLQQLKVANLSRDRALLPTIESIARQLHGYAEASSAVDAIVERWISVRESYAEV